MLLPLIEQYKAVREFAEYHPVSATTGEGLDRVRDAIVSRLPEGPAYFPADHLTDQPERFLAGRTDPRTDPARDAPGSAARGGRAGRPLGGNAENHQDCSHHLRRAGRAKGHRHRRQAAQRSRKSERWRATKWKRCSAAKSFWSCLSKFRKIGAKIPNFSTPLTGAPCGEENWTRTKVRFLMRLLSSMRLIGLTILLALVLTPLFAEKDKTPVSDDVIVDQVRVKLADDSEVGGQPIRRGRSPWRGDAYRQSQQRQIKVKAEKWRRR